jgi:hypothetical protein
MPSGGLFKTLLGALLEFLKSLLNFLKTVLLFLPYLLIWLFRLLHKIIHGKFKEPETYEDVDCPKIPPENARRPDPCLYSQSYLASQGIAVTWDNPDIRLTTPNGVPVPPGPLQADTDYVVIGTIHNASFDAATGVVVRSYFRAWGVDFDDRTPTEVDANGDAAQRIVSIEPWGQRTASFSWHTPAAPGHFCVTIECFHPADKEPANNVGQENTDVVALAANSSARVTIPFFNRRAREDEFWIDADAYAIVDEPIEFRLTRLADKPRPDDGRVDVVARAVGDRAGTVVVTERLKTREIMHGSRIRLTGDGKRPRRGEDYEVFTYTGIDQLVIANDAGAQGLPEGWTVTIPGVELDGGRWHLRVSPNETAMLSVDLGVGPNVPSGDRHPININARDRFGNLVGGVTVYAEVGL